MLRWGLPNFEAGGSQGNITEFEYQAEQPALLEERLTVGNHPVARRATPPESGGEFLTAPLLR